MRSFFKSFIFLISFLSFSSSFAGIKYASPNGNDSNSGTEISNPLSLSFAFSNQSPLNSGDTLLLLDGQYSGNFTLDLSGSIDKPIYILPQNSGKVFINPGENKTNGKALVINGSNVWLIGLHITSTSVVKRADLGENVQNESGITVFGENVKLINCWIYDVPGVALELWRSSLDLEVYGCVIFNNGTQSSLRGTGHGLYIQHNQIDKPKIIRNNIIFQNASQGIDIYTTDPINGGINVIENTSFNTGAIANFDGFVFRPPHNLTIGSKNNLSYEMKVYDNIFYSDLQGGRLTQNQVSNVTIGRTYQPNDKIEFYNNLLVGGRNVVEFQPLENLKFTGNTFYNNHGKFFQFLTLPNSMDGTYWDKNFYYQTSSDDFPFTGNDFDQWKISSGFDIQSTYSKSFPQDPKVIIRQNKYETGKYYVTIVNPAKTSSVKVDFYQFGIENGSTFQIIDIQNPFYSDYFVEGAYIGQSLEFPMNHNLSLAPKGNMPNKPVHTDESFGVFQVIFKSENYIPVFKSQIELALNVSGVASTDLADYLENEPAQNWTGEFSKGPNFNCENIGTNEVQVKILDGEGNEWTQVVKVIVKDLLPPSLQVESKTLEFDKSKGVLEVVPDQFITSLDDNCGIESITLSKSRFECSDLESSQEISLLVKDKSGNQTSKSVIVEFTILESQKVSLQADGPLYSGETVELTLGNELDYEVINWIRDGEIMDGVQGKTIAISQGGLYFASIQLTSGCVVESNHLQLSQADAPYPPIKSLIELELDENGEASLQISDLFTSWPTEQELTITTSNLIYDCGDLGENIVSIHVENLTGQVWEETTTVLVRDIEKPFLVLKDPSLVFDLSKGFTELTSSMLIDSTSDNCEVASISLSKSRFICSDLDSPQEVKVTVKDKSGNETSKTIVIEFSIIESQKISLQANKPLYSGATVELSLGEELGYEVISWYRNGSIMDGIKGKTIVVNQAGNYFATLRLASGCIVESSKLEISVTDVPFAPVKELIELELNKNGVASLEISDFFTSWPPSQDLEITTSDLNFDCESLGEHTIEIRIESQSGQVWEETTTVLVKDNSKPVIVSKNVSLNFDPSVGAIELTPEMFVESVTDNCGIKSLSISKQKVGCGDFSSETLIEIRAEDNSGNVTESTATLNLTWVDSKPVFIEGVTELCEGNSTELTLSSEAEFEVVRWRRNGVELAGQSGKTITIEEGGEYHAVIRYSSGCLAETDVFEVQLIDIPQGEITVDGNILTAPEGMYSYQWYKGDQAISGAANQTFEVNQMGSFSVSITNELGCSTHLKAVEMTISGLPGGKQIEAVALLIYPNPSKAEVVFEPKSDLEFAENSWKVYDLSGKNVGQSVFMIHQSPKQIRLDVSTLASGTYTVMVESQDNRIFLGRFIKLD